MVKNTWTSARPTANRSGTTMSKASGSRPYQLCLSFFATATLFIVGTDAGAQSYTFTTLGTQGGESSFANGINNHGQVVGYSQTTGNAAQHAVIWSERATTELGTLGGNYSEAQAINDAGQVAGFSYVNGDVVHATVWNGTTATDLGTYGGKYSYALGINSAAQVVGWSTTSSGEGHATVWNGTTPTDLGTLGGNYSIAFGINGGGTIVGSAYSADPTVPLATLWNVSAPIPLGGTFSGRYSAAQGINGAGQIVGYRQTIASQQAVLWNNAGAAPTVLASLGGTISDAQGINATGQVVGHSQTTAGVLHATLWDGSSTIDLNTFAVGAGWVLQTATGINDNGWITGTAVNNLTGLSEAYLLIPSAVPLPGGFSLTFAGLSMLGFVIRRRKAVRPHGMSYNC